MKGLRLTAILLVLGLAGQAEAGTCGNGVVEAGEQCDDGNTGSGDGCKGCEVEGCCDSDFGVYQFTTTESACNEFWPTMGATPIFLPGMVATCSYEVCNEW
ncbi:MAG: hypothetical protein VCB80_07750, partial [Deltaproteobacteria bacterium]